MQIAPPSTALSLVHDRERPGDFQCHIKDPMRVPSLAPRITYEQQNSGSSPKTNPPDGPNTGARTVPPPGGPSHFSTGNSPPAWLSKKRPASPRPGQRQPKVARRTADDPMQGHAQEAPHPGGSSQAEPVMPPAVFGLPTVDAPFVDPEGGVHHYLEERTHGGMDASAPIALNAMIGGPYSEPDNFAQAEVRLQRNARALSDVRVGQFFQGVAPQVFKQVMSDLGIDAESLESPPPGMQTGPVCKSEEALGLDRLNTDRMVLLVERQSGDATKPHYVAFRRQRKHQGEWGEWVLLDSSKDGQQQGVGPIQYLEKEAATGFTAFWPASRPVSAEEDAIVTEAEEPSRTDPHRATTGGGAAGNTLENPALDEDYIDRIAGSPFFNGTAGIWNRSKEIFTALGYRGTRNLLEVVRECQRQKPGVVDGTHTVEIKLEGLKDHEVVWDLKSGKTVYLLPVPPGQNSNVLEDKLVRRRRAGQKSWVDRTRR